MLQWAVKPKFTFIISLLYHPLHIFLSLLSAGLLSPSSAHPSCLPCGMNQILNLGVWTLGLFVLTLLCMVTATATSSLSPDMETPVHFPKFHCLVAVWAFHDLEVHFPHEYINSFLYLLLHWHDEPIINQEVLFTLEVVPTSGSEDTYCIAERKYSPKLAELSCQEGKVQIP